MDLITELNLAIEYIEENMTDEAALGEVSKVTTYSPYHFQRIFNYITGIPLSEYIRRRKLSLAVIDFQREEKVIDVAMKYGYNSSDSFTRAFTKQHGVTPSLIKKEAVEFNMYPIMSFQLSVKGIEKMTFRIESKKAFDMFGVYKEIEEANGVAREEIESFRKKCDEDNTFSEMNTFFGYDPDTMLHGLLYDHNGDTFKYMLCQYMRDGIYVPDKYVRLHIPAGRWAIFSADHCKVSDLWARIYSEWLPSSSYELRNSTSFEMYYGNRRKGDVRGEIWIPIKQITTVHGKNSQNRLRYKKVGENRMCGKFKVVDFVYGDQWNAPLFELWQEVNRKYPEGIYWSWDPNSNEGKNVFLCLDDKDRVIGKGHAMIYENQEDDAPGYAEHRIFIHYRVLPEYENNEQVLDLLYQAVFERALELRKTLSNRACQLYVGNYNMEEVYNTHIQKKDWPEHGSVYHLSAPTRIANEYRKLEIPDIIFKEFSLDNEEFMRNLIVNDQICFRENISGPDTYGDLAESDYLAYGAFVKNHKGEEIIVGSVLVEMEEGYIPEIVGVMVLPEYRRRYMAAVMLEYALEVLHKKGKDKVWLVTPSNNHTAIAMYKKLGFTIDSQEQRYMKYI